MKKIIYIIAVITMVFNYIYSQQNLVSNQSFEINAACPNISGGNIYKVLGWDTCKGSPDYFNSCATNSLFQVPKNYFGYQQPMSGSAYAGFINFDVNGFYREIIGTQLSFSLTINQKYYISYKISRADSNYVVGYSTNNIGVRLAKIKPTVVGINNWAHFNNNNIISDTLNWTRVFGSFIADSSYKYLMIGNFFDDAHTTLVNDGNGEFAYYYIDDICLSIDSAFTQNYITGLKENDLIDKITILPNPADKYITIKDFIKNIEILNSIGNQILFQNVSFYANENIIECSFWPTGIYFFKINNIIYKIVINH